MILFLLYTNHNILYLTVIKKNYEKYWDIRFLDWTIKGKGSIIIKLQLDVG